MMQGARMKPDLTQILHCAPGLDRGQAQAHLQRLSERYFETFTPAQIAAHITRVSALSPREPLSAEARENTDGTLTITIVAFDYPFAFSLITGLLGASGFSITSGSAFTYHAQTTAASRAIHRQRHLHRRYGGDLPARRKIIDTLHGTLAGTVAVQTWLAAVPRELETIFVLLERNDPDSITRAKMIVNERMVTELHRLHLDYDKILYPISIDIDTSREAFTRMRIQSEDTPFFLYTLSTAFSLHDIQIQSVDIRTTDEQVCDEFDLVERTGRKITDRHTLDGLKLSVLLTKQFTYFLGNAPDPYSALTRFEELVEEIAAAPDKSVFLDLLSNPAVMQDLAQLFGASTFLWEDFIRRQYEELLPLLKETSGTQPDFIEPIETLYWRLEDSLRDASGLDQAINRINAFKDREIFNIDLDHIVNHPTDFKRLSERLTMLAEIVINMTTGLVYSDMTRRFGTPRTAAGLPARYSILGLGKFGGVALGYASDIELLFLYSDNGTTDGPAGIDNAEFFNRLARDVARAVRSKREGIFTIDLRLRPYGKDGPLACSLDTFCEYYSRGGTAHSYERLSLVRLRAVGGDSELGMQLERLRDDMIYATRSIDIRELRVLREKQLNELSRPGTINVKFSQGGLVDLEYTVQLLQVIHGATHPQLRSPRIHRALTELARAGLLDPGDSRKLEDAYDFLRRLINGLRMLRGNARDLFLPPTGSIEFVHLARRMGYGTQQDLEPAKRLELDFNTKTAIVRTFIERHFGRSSLPGPAVGNVADLVLSRSLPEELSSRILQGYGFVVPQRACCNLLRLAGEDSWREQFATLALLACDILKTRPDPDMALNNWERFVSSLPESRPHYEMLLYQPMRLDILMSIFSGSQFLSDTLIRNPDFFEWITQPDTVNSLLRHESATDDLRRLLDPAGDLETCANLIRTYKKRHILRIGTRDICLHTPIRDIVRELSTLADVIVQAALDTVCSTGAAHLPAVTDPGACRGAFCVMAFGKLGGRELNYSSDIDLLGVFDATALQAAGLPAEESRVYLSAVMAGLRDCLSRHTAEGCAFRVDLRLRPYGNSGPIVHSLQQLLEYYTDKASLWEVQALLKLRPVAGTLPVGEHLMELLRPVLLQPRAPTDIFFSIDNLRTSAIEQLERHGIDPAGDVKNGPGGIRDIEFLVQGLQLANVNAAPAILEGNTLEALKCLGRYEVVPPQVCTTLAEHYVFLRRVEHLLQIYEDRQIHALPRDPAALTALAQRLLGIEGNAAMLREQIQNCQEQVRKIYRCCISGTGTVPDC